MIAKVKAANPAGASPIVNATRMAPCKSIPFIGAATELRATANRLTKFGMSQKHMVNHRRPDCTHDHRHILDVTVESLPANVILSVNKKAEPG